MKFKHIFYATLFAAAMLLPQNQGFAIPAQRGVIVFQQPDGSSFKGYIRGDEFSHISTTLGGEAITQDSEGWWCYAVFDSEGKRHCSGVRVGGAASGVSLSGSSTSLYGASRASVIARSRNIPYEKIGSAARGRRQAVSFLCPDGETPMKKFLRENGALSKASSKASAGTKATSKVQKNGIIILAAFKDVPFTYTREDFVNLVTQSGYSLDGADGSAVDYFNDMFSSQIDFNFDISEIVTLPKNRKYYGGNDDDGQDLHPEEMIKDACELAHDAGVDFSKYDDDSDGYVDNVFVFYSGGDAAEGAGDDCIWAHAYYIYSGSARIELTLDGKRIDRYACSAELKKTTEGFQMARIGTFCHEFTHTFGLMDLYDTDYEKSGGQSEALWHVTALMDGGNSNNLANTPPYYNAVEREDLGIGTAISLTNGVHTLRPINESGEYYRLDGPVEGEYFLFECRDNSSKWDKYIGGSGLLVYHVDKSASDAGKSDNYAKSFTAAERWKYNEVNCRPKRQCADLIEADPSTVTEFNSDGYELSYSTISRIFFPSSKTPVLDNTSGLEFTNGGSCTVSISDIKLNSDKSVTFTVKGVGAVVKTDVFQTSAIVNITDDALKENVRMKYWAKSAKDTVELSLTPLSDGRVAALLDSLSTSTTYSVEVRGLIDGKDSLRTTLSFKTRAIESKHPVIALGSTGRALDGSFATGTKLPLMLYNASGAVEVHWYFNGKEIEAGEDYYWSLSGSGKLKAVIFYEDGRKIAVTKDITVK